MYSTTCSSIFFFLQAEDGIRDPLVTGVQTCALPISGLAVYGVLEGWQAGKGYVHIDGGSYLERRGKDLGYYGDGGASSNSIDCMEGKLRGKQPVSGQSPLDSRKPRIFSTRKAIKRYSRDTFFLFQCLRE